ncbi:hypothetical protein E2C01_093175 [Portunus trituberculatus]|uniref:Uncharacterized protein n=1 Tax=Portunus trituberculatus TaxID=210409 RepID=A0A5B7JSK4_PORTR|nr:hypothetical protein [Portunus trituberculatus]
MRVKQTQAAPASNVSYASTTDLSNLLQDPSTTTASPSTSASSSAKTTTTTTKTSTPITSSAPYLSAISRTPSKGEKTDKSNKLNLTKLERQRPYCRRRSRAVEEGFSRSLLLDELRRVNS